MLISFANKINGQINIIGSIKDSSSKPIVGASITLHKKNSALVIAFSISDTKGIYHIQYTNAKPADTFFLKANAIGYAIKEVFIKSDTKNVEYILTATPRQLADVTVKHNKPYLKYKADTLSYNVDSFTQKQDRTIGDVLRKMPGIDVDANGKISYNGKTITNFYIDGDNLLDDRYNIATNNIPASIVKDVQVLENHQPIRALKDITYSDKIGINLSLKPKAKLKLAARTELALGYSDNTCYNETLNVMAFKKRYKAINYIKTNNTGNDLSDDIISHNLQDYLKSIQNDIPDEMLNLSLPSNPNIDKPRYLFNNATLANANNLFTTKKGTQAKLNMYYLHDKQSQYYTNNSFFYFPTDTVKYLQQQNTSNQSTMFRSQLNLNSNKEKAYWNNTATVEINKKSANASTVLNGLFTDQNLLQSNSAFSNEFNFIKTKHTKNIIEGYSYFSFLDKPENLQINPGINSFIFNNNIPYKSLVQKANTPTYFTNNYISYRPGSHTILQSYRIGFTAHWQQLKSGITAEQYNNSINNLSDSFINNIQWNQQKIYAKADYDYLGKSTKISISIPLALYLMDYANTNKSNHLDFNRVLANPSILIKQATGLEDNITAAYSFGNSVGTVQDVFKSYVLQNYNQLMANSLPFKLANTHTISLGYSYRKTIKIFFVNIGIIYNNSNNNSILNTTFSNNMQHLNLIAFENAGKSVTLLSSISKYSFKLHTTITVKGSIKSGQWSQMQNGIPVVFANNTYSFTSTITPKINNLITLGYTANLTWMNSKAREGNILPQSIMQMHHFIEANVFANKNFFFTLKGEDFYIEQKTSSGNNYFFADASATLKIDKIKTDFIFEVSNVANTNKYVTASITANRFVESSFNIRPRMLLVKAILNL